MSDILSTWNDGGTSWQVAGPSLADDGGLQTAVILSLFTDRLADASDSAVAPTARRGWWGDAFAEVAGDQIGSRLWQLQREKQLPQVVARAQLYAREALQWLVDDGVADSVTVLAEVTAPGVLGMQISIKRSSAPVLQFRFNDFWKGQ